MATGFPNRFWQALFLPENDCLRGFTGGHKAIHTACMTPTLTALNAFLVLLSWQGQTDTTYTVQTSLDLHHWSTLPAVFNGGLEELSLAIEAGVSPLFTRLRASTDGDTNENGLPDQWEWSRFGFIDVDPLADPDHDGASNYTEWLAGTDPLDSFNGERAIIRLASGDEWIVPANEISGQALGMSLTRANGEPWPNAPVTLRLDSGQAGLLQAGEDPDNAVHEVIAYTDHLGRISPAGHAIHVLGAAADGSDHLRVSAGQSVAAIRIRTVTGELNAPPRELRVNSIDDGTSAYTWRGDPSGAEAFLIETRSSDGDWITVAQLAASELPSPDPSTGRYKLALDSF
jgi:hypothetical protein